MGSVTKFVRSQMAALNLESESSNIIRTMRANKIPGSLSQLLDTTLQDSHDLRIFGLGTLCTMSSLERYARFTNAMHGIYKTMEDELDKSSTKSPAIELFWMKHQDILRRSHHLEQDLADVLGKDSLTYTKATDNYIQAIQVAGESDRESGGARLLGHAYTRYLADLMGGQVLGEPTRMALDLPRGTPRHYNFPMKGTRREYVELIYQDLNESGTLLKKDKKEEVGNQMMEDVVVEARGAFRHNIHVYSEEPITLDAIIGVKNVATGFIFRR